MLTVFHNVNPIIENMWGEMIYKKNLNDILNQNVKRENRELKQLRRRRQGQRQKTIGFMSKTTALHEHHAF